MNRDSREGDRLLEAVAGGSSDAFEQLYDRYAPTLYGLLLRILAQPEDAQEVLQETFSQVWRSAGSFDRSRGSEMAWLISIARSRGIDRLRARRTRADREIEAGQEISRRATNVGSSGGGERDAILSELRMEVRKALEELPQAQLAALELAYFQGLSQSQIAERLGEPLGTIKTRMQLGMKKLRERMKDIRV